MAAHPAFPTGSMGPPFRSPHPRVLIAGGGIAGLELVLALRKLAGRRVEMEVLAPGADFVYRPLLVAEPFGIGTAHRVPLETILRNEDVAHRQGELASVQAGLHEVTTGAGERLRYDALVLAMGARPVPALEGALTFAGPQEVEPLGELVQRAERGELRRLVFALPRQARAWPLPLYELALMTATRAGGAEITLVTPERAPLELFGSAASGAVRARLDLAGVEVRTGAAPVNVLEHGVLLLDGGATIAADAVVALPRLEVPRFPGIPQGDAGFVRVDEHCQVEGLADVYAAGDVTDFPVKQGGFAARQAQTAAVAIAMRAGAPVSHETLDPVLRGVLLSGERATYLEAGEEASPAPLWWPPTKIADSYLVPYLVSRFRLAVDPEHAGKLGDVVSSALAGRVQPRTSRLDR
jgi:sulfide:quinone oxidoreductase